ncbi:MAG TPA: NAD(P)(+) transhydrogenase (Re/Si-specific) subunit alpha, partial [Enterovirga sp.]
MRIAVLSDAPAETRVAATPETVKKYIALGADVVVQSGAGVSAGVPDAEFQAGGATIAQDAAAAARDADIVLKVRRPSDAEVRACKPGALVIAIMDPYGQDAALKAMAEARVAAFAMELMPRITRAQVMDVLS